MINSYLKATLPVPGGEKKNKHVNNSKNERQNINLDINIKKIMFTVNEITSTRIN